jgi:hypothetical protein
LWLGEYKDGSHPVWFVCNQTPRPIWLEHQGRVFTLAPLEERQWPSTRSPGEAFPLDRLIERHQLEVVRRQLGSMPDPAVAGAARVWLIVGVLWLASVWPLSTWWWLRIGGVLAIGAALCFLALLTRPARHDARELMRQEGRQLARRTWNNAVMAAVLAIGVLMPAAALYFATDLHDIVSVRTTGFSVDTGKPLVLIGRLTQLTFIAVATLLPALMYFQFDAERLSTLRSRWMQNVFRLDPTVSTVSDVLAKYGCQLDEAYGSRDDQRGRLVRGRRSPIIVATVILAFGWLLILLRAGGRIDAADAGSNGLSFIDLLDPNPSLVTYAFLGAYFFAVQLIWQGYVRADLRPKTYTTVTVRVLVVVVLAWLIDATLGASQPANVLYLLAFFAGIVPNTVLHFVAEKVLGRLAGTFNRDQLQQLTVLDGIDLYERTRLSEEGITSVEALAHHDLLDLFFKTRISAARLIDWADQAILAMYLGTDAGGTVVPSASTLRDGLRAVGIRTATDLVDATRRARPGNKSATDLAGAGVCAGTRQAGQLTAASAAPPDADAGTDRPRAGALALAQVGVGARRVDRVARAVAATLPDVTAADLAERLCLISAGLDRSEWIGRIEYWRHSDLIEEEGTRRWYVDGNGDLRQADPRTCQHGSSRAGSHPA